MSHAEKVVILLALFSTSFEIAIYKSILADNNPELLDNILAVEQLSQLDVLWENSGIGFEISSIPIVTKVSHTNSQNVILSMFQESSAELQEKISISMHHFYPTSTEFENGAIEQLKDLGKQIEIYITTIVYEKHVLPFFD